jgi:hypothetical protein
MAAVQQQQIHLGDVTQGQSQFQQQAAAIPEIAALLQKTANLDNSAYQKGVFGLDPNIQGNIASVDEMSRLYGLGAVDDETRAALNRQTAYNALQGGFRGPDATAATGGNPAQSAQSAAQAVAVGKEAINRQAQAPALAQEAAQASLALNPTHVDVGSTLISPAALLARQDAADYYNNNLSNQALLINAQGQATSNQQSGNAIASGAGGLLSGVGGIAGMF